jgi:hypothetical protein
MPTSTPVRRPHFRPKGGLVTLRVLRLLCVSRKKEKSIDRGEAVLRSPHLGPVALAGHRDEFPVMVA